LPRNGREKESRVRARVPWPAGILTAAALPRASFLGLLPSGKRGGYGALDLAKPSHWSVVSE